MSYSRIHILSLILCGTILFTQAPARAEQMEGRARCITCEMEVQNNRKTPDQLAMEAFAKRLMDNYNASRTAAKKPQIACISCRKVEVTDTAKGSKAVSTDDVWSKYPEIMSYSNSSKVQKMIDVAVGNSAWVLNMKTRQRVSKRNHLKPTGNCLRHVKQAADVSGVTKGYINASRVNWPEGNMVKKLKADGFKNLLEDPIYSDLIKNAASAPKGAILLYAGGDAGGHTEIKTEFGNKGTYVSDFQQPQSIMQNAVWGRNSKNYRLIGVMVKPGV